MNMPTGASRDNAAAQRAKLRRRIQGFYKHLNDQNWARCFEYVDPILREQQRILFADYCSSLAAFQDRYAPIALGHMELNLHSGVQKRKGDSRDFAYGLIVWKDKEHVAHLFRERWVLDADVWYTRMVGLVTPENAAAQAERD